MPKRKKTKYRKITFKLTDRQRKSLEAYCRAIDTTPVKFIKESIRHATDGGSPDTYESSVSDRQLDLEEVIREISEEEQAVYKKRNQDFPKDLFS